MLVSPCHNKPYSTDRVVDYSQYYSDPRDLFDDQDKPLDMNRTSTITFDGKDINLTSPILTITNLGPDNLFSTPNPKGTPAYLGTVEYWTSSLAQTLSCQPSGYYKWGFSYFLLFIIACLNTIWVLIMFLLWWSTMRFSRTHRKGRELGLYRAAMDLCTALRKDLGDEAEVLPDAALQHRAKMSKFGMHFPDESLLVSICQRSKYRRKESHNTISDDGDESLYSME
jgi:hypothetical protein